jgi:hypothetical protein
LLIKDAEEAGITKRIGNFSRVDSKAQRKNDSAVSDFGF